MVVRGTKVSLQPRQERAELGQQSVNEVCKKKSGIGLVILVGRVERSRMIKCLSKKLGIRMVGRVERS